MDRIDRRGFLECAAWAGTGLVWAAAGGVLSSRTLAEAAAPAADFTFVQVSDSHVGFTGQANHDAVASLRAVVDRINAMPARPALDRKSTRLNSSHIQKSRMPSSA